MYSYKNEKNGINLFNNLNKDVPLFWIWTVKDLLIVCLWMFFFSGAEQYFLALFAMACSGVFVPIIRHRYGLEVIYQQLTPSFMGRRMKVFISDEDQVLRD